MVAIIEPGDHYDADAAAGERWSSALASLEYAERHTASPLEVERLANDVIEARVSMFRTGVQGGWALPAFLQTALARDRELLDIQGSLR